MVNVLALHILVLCMGLLFVIKGGDMFVDSSIQIAHRLNIPRIFIGATIVSLGTTAPEMMVSATASGAGNTGIALGNALGSAIANIGLIVGVISFISAIEVSKRDFRWSYSWMFFSAILVAVLAFDFYVGKRASIVLLMVATFYLVSDCWRLFKNKKDHHDPEEKEILLKKTNWFKDILFFSTGLILVLGGSRLLVMSGMGLAQTLGVPSAVIGLSIIAIGTSLPELITGISSAKKGVADLSIGNILGANVLNLALIVGVASGINPLQLSKFERAYSFPWLFVFVILMGVCLGFTGKLKKGVGFVFLSLYFVYCLGLFIVPALTS